MKSIDVVFVKIYLTESSGLLPSILKYLKSEAQIRGASVFRAINGFGDTGNHTAALVDLSLDLPLCIEFYDHADRVYRALDHLGTMIKPEHIVFWEAKSNG